MDQEPDGVTGPKPGELRHQIDETRNSLTHKLETLEEQVRDTVQGAKNTVEYTIENVKATVQDTVETVKQTFDIPYQVQQHPWPCLGFTALAGFALGTWVNGRESLARQNIRAHWTPTETAHADRYQTSSELSLSNTAQQSHPQSQPSQPGVVDKVLDQFHEEVDMVKELAVGAAVGIVRDLAKSYLPNFSSEIQKVMDSMTRKMGGKPFDHPVVETTSSPFQDRTRNQRSPQMSGL